MMQDKEFEVQAEAFVEKIQQLTSNSGYFERFFELCAETRTYREAWECLEDEREDFGLPERYSSYESFRRGKSYHLNNLVRVNSDGE